MSLLPFFALVAFGGGLNCQTAIDQWPDDSIVILIPCNDGAPDGECVVANAGDDFSAASGDTVSLDGSATTVPHDPAEVAYFWEQIDNGAPSVSLSNPETSSPGFLPTVEAVYQFQLTTTWFCRQDSDVVEVNIDNSRVPSELDAEFLFSTPCQPVQVTAPPGDDARLFIVTKSGVIHIYRDGSLLPTPFLDIQDVVTGPCASSSEQGLLGMAFHPDFANNGLFYVNYTGTFTGAGGGSGDTRIVGFAVDGGNPDIADASSASLLMSISQPEGNHNGGQLLFSPLDGYLYIGTGDGGGGGDNHGAIGNGQNRQTLLGKMLRIEVNGLDPYTIPPDNPFVGDPTTLDEIWALGLRNPWRFSFDRMTGDLYIGDVGQGQWEELDIQMASSQGGENYGWRLREGAHCFNPPTDCDPGGLTDPDFEETHGNGWCSIIAGFVYRGQNVAGLDGYFIFTDWCGSAGGDYRITYRLDKQWVTDTLSVFVDGNPLTRNIIGFGEDNRGEIYLCDFGSNNIYRITGIRNFHP